MTPVLALVALACSGVGAAAVGENCQVDDEMSALHLGGTAPYHHFKQHLKTSNSKCSPASCCDGQRFTCKGSGGKPPSCYTKLENLVADAWNATHYAANPTWQRLHVTITKNDSCTSWLGGAKLIFEFSENWCGTGSCYHYWPITGLKPSSDKTEADLKNYCGFVAGKCENNYKSVSGWHATVSRLEELDVILNGKPKKDWLDEKKWSVKNWTIEQLNPPYHDCKSTTCP